MNRKEISGKDIICIPIDLRLFIEIAASKPRLSYKKLLHILRQNYDGEYRKETFDETYPTAEIYFIVDGIDELSGNPLHVQALSRLLENLIKFGNILVTCRTRDFEYVFAPHLDPVLFDEILRIKEWEVDTEFTEFVQKLAKADLFINGTFLQQVKNSTTLRTLVSRPLHARMLTYVSKSDIKKFADLSQLYVRYLHKYARVVDANLLKENCLRKAETHLLWRELAWFAFQKDLFVHDKIPLTNVSEYLINMQGIRPTCVSRLLQPLFNFTQVFHSTQLQFIHYSFFEYLVAEHMAYALDRNFISNATDIYIYFAKDMTPEIRHHLMRIINRTKTSGFGKWLAKGYFAINEAAPNPARRKVANNLLVYILGRLTNEDVSNEIRHLLEIEEDAFLRTCLYWGLSAAKGIDGVKEYMEVLRTNAKMRSLNQGYLLYYYSDLDRSKDPPYLDDDPSRSWANTKLRTLQFMAEPSYHTRVPLGRRIIDLYTFYDFCIFRSEQILPDEENILATNVLGILEIEIKDKVIIKRLQEMHQQVVG